MHNCCSWSSLVEGDRVSLPFPPVCLYSAGSAPIKIYSRVEAGVGKGNSSEKLLR